MEARSSQRGVRWPRGERGVIALSMAIIVALIGAIASYALLTIAISNARQARFYRTRLPARYAAEAAIVWAQQQLSVSPGFCGGTHTVGGVPVSVTVTNCVAGNPHTLSAKVTY